MIKRVFSLIVAFVVVICSLSAFPFSAEASSYETKLKNKGFTDSYAQALATLHKKYPNWEFEPFVTGLKWSDAVKGEHNPHDKQLIQKQNSLNKGYYCDCEKCMRNGSYVIQEGSSWVSASEATVKYYLDPRNWLDEKAIFQFESTAYNSKQTIAGIESIISSTWMSDSYITYKNSEGKTKTYKDKDGNKVKYSTAIMQSAKDSGMSAYYLASKIVQEVGGAKNTAGGASGTYKGYEGIYNYYNIGAYTGAGDGLKWASLSSTTYKTNCSANLRSSANTSSSVKVKLPYGTQLTYVSSTIKQADGYVWYNVKVTYNNKAYTGYIRSDLVTITTPTYNRPWTNPYLTIYNGATYIAKSFSTYQFTGYLQKFNVNPESSSLYNHEYMANVQASVSEAKITYNAYSKANVLSSAKIFYIPVFESMPSKPCPAPTASSGSNTNNNNTTSPSSPSSSPSDSSYAVTNLKLTDSTTESLSFSWKGVEGATKYEVYVTNDGRGTHFSKESENEAVTLNNLTMGNKYTVKVRAYVKKSWRAYSEPLTYKTKPDKVSELVVTNRTATTATLKWNRVEYADGYIIYQLEDGKYSSVKTVSGGDTLSAKIKGLSGGSIYKFKVSAYVDSKRAGEKSKSVTTKTKPHQVSGVKLTPTSSTIKVTWSRVKGNADGYKVSFARDKEFTDVIATRRVEGQDKLSYTGKNLTRGRSYYVRVRAYKKIGSKTYYGEWSPIKKTTCK